MVKVGVIGGGGREHSGGWSVSLDEAVEKVIYFKGNGGTEEGKGVNHEIDLTKKENFKYIPEIIEKESIDMFIVGPEQPLVDGIVDHCYNMGFNNIFGPTSAASIIEADKFYSHELMVDTGVPCAESILCKTKEEAEKAIKKLATEDGIVIKARGLTGGKGVYVCDSKDEALAKLPEHIKAFKSEEILIAERLFGQEYSVFGISDGERVVPIEMSIQDHKPLLDEDKGPNTGGMGAYGPAPIAGAKIVRYVADKMMTPIVQGMKKENREFKGFLYAAVIDTEQGPEILEYNCRFGDPEAQPAVMMFKNGLYQPIKAALEGKLNEINVEFKPGASCCVVMASNGYPYDYKKGFPIGGLEEAAQKEDVKVFNAGTKKDNGNIITSGGRVLGVTAYSAKGIADAQLKAYEAAHIIDEATTKLNNKIVFIYRKDIAKKALSMVG